MRRFFIAFINYPLFIFQGNASQIVYFRLDYSSWYHLAMTKSVFWGSILAAVITCTVTFILNLLWITCRNVGLWWIKRIGSFSTILVFDFSDIGLTMPYCSSLSSLIYTFCSERNDQLWRQRTVTPSYSLTSSKPDRWESQSLYESLIRFDGR